MVEIQDCFSNCSINNILLKFCIMKCKGGDELNITDFFLDSILEGLESNNLDINILNNNLSITLEYNQIKIILLKIRNDINIIITNNNLSDCIYKQRLIYNISNETYLYMLYIEINHLELKKYI